MKIVILFSIFLLLSGCASENNKMFIHGGELFLKKGLLKPEIETQLSNIGFYESFDGFIELPIELEDDIQIIDSFDTNIKLSEEYTGKMQELEMLLAERNGSDYDILLYEYKYHDLNIDCGVLVEYEILEDGTNKLNRFSVIQPKLLYSVHKLYRANEELKLLKKGNKLLPDDIMNVIKSLPVSH